MVCFECFGKRYLVKGLSAEELSLVSERTGLSQGVLLEENDRSGEFVFTRVGSYFDFYQPGQMTVQAQPLELLIEILSGRMIKMTAAAYPEFLFLRGEVVCLPDGTAVVLPGPSLVGKSRLAQSLVQAGASHWSWEAIAIDAQGRLLPYPYSRVPEERIDAGGIALVTYDPNGKWTPETLTAGQTLISLMPLVMTSIEDTPRVLSILGKLCARAKWRCRGTRQDGSEFMRFLATPTLSA